MAYNGYLGPAGLFSTDDRAADQRQIEAEQYDPFEFDLEDDYLLDEADENNYLTDEDYEQDADTMEAYGGSTDCGVWFLETIKVNDYEDWVRRMEARHQAECGCTATFTFCHS